MVEPEPQPSEVLVEDEPRYLRRQKPLEVRRRKFGARAWKLYAKVGLGVVAAAGSIWLVYQTAHFLLDSPRFALLSPDQVELAGNHIVPRSAVLEKFLPDRGRSVFRVPLEERRAALEEIRWVEQASCQRVLPNRIRVDLVERTPVAFLRSSTELALIDAYGVILERPLQGDYRFPVVTGVGEGMPLAEREKRMRLYVHFLKEVEAAQRGATEHVSEVDLTEPSDLRATLAGMPELGDPAQGGQASVLVHFGNGEFERKFRMFVDNIGQWRAAAGRVESVDLRFERQVVVNPETQNEPTAAQSFSKPAR